MSKRGGSIDSFDMLLDTMCNTFGGVCFIALLIAIISANLPRIKAQQTEPDVKIIEQNVELTNLSRKKDELLVAIKYQSGLLTNQTVNVSRTRKDLKELGTSIEKNELLRIESEAIYQSIMRQIETLGADILRYNREYEQLANLEKELKDRLNDLKQQNSQVARAPMEHATSKRALHFIFQKGRAALLNEKPRQLNDTEFSLIRESRGWLVSPKPEFGIQIDQSFRESELFKRLLKPAKDDNYFVNLVTDEFSFPEVCLVRDALIQNRIEYGWQHFSGYPIRYGAGGSSAPQ